LVTTNTNSSPHPSDLANLAVKCKIGAAIILSGITLLPLPRLWCLLTIDDQNTLSKPLPLLRLNGEENPVFSKMVLRLVSEKILIWRGASKPLQ